MSNVLNGTVADRQTLTGALNTPKQLRGSVTPSGGGGAIDIKELERIVDEYLAENPPEDGFSPLVSVTDITGGHRVSITDKDGEKSFDVLNGKDGTGGGGSGGGEKAWSLLGEYTFTEDAPVSAITLTDLPSCTEFMVYFVGTKTSVATADISFYINGTRVFGRASADWLVFRAHLELQDCWNWISSINATSVSGFHGANMNNGHDGHTARYTEPAVSLQIKNMYGASSFKEGSVTIYGR